MTIRGPTLKLSSGAEMPLFGLGTWLSSSDEVSEAVRCALDCGYRLIDTAEIYGNEKEIGDVLEEYFKAKKLKREDVFITTKCFCNHFQTGETEFAIRESLKKLKLEYVDLYLAHAPTAFNHDITVQDHSVTVEQIWKNLENVYKKGLAKAIGVSNFNISQIERIRKIATVPVDNCQVECHLYFPQFEMVEFCKKHNISFTAYSPLGSPGRFKYTLPPGTEKGWQESPSLFEDTLVKQLGEKYHKTSAQILLRHLLQRGLAVIPKSVNPKRIEENWNIFDFELTETEMKKLNSPKHQQRVSFWDFVKRHPEDPFKNERN